VPSGLAGLLALPGLIHQDVDLRQPDRLTGDRLEKWRN